MKIDAEIVMYSENFELHCLVEPDLSIGTYPMYFFKYINDSKIDLEWDSIEYFLDITKEKKKGLKIELKDKLKGNYVKGMIREIKELVKHGIKLNLINNED